MTTTNETDDAAQLACAALAADAIMTKQWFVHHEVTPPEGSGLPVAHVFVLLGHGQVADDVFCLLEDVASAEAIAASGEVIAGPCPTCCGAPAPGDDKPEPTPKSPKKGRRIFRRRASSS